MTFLLDANACIALINGKPPSARIRLRHALDAGAEVFVPAIVLSALWCAAEKSARREASTERVQSFLSGSVRVLSFDEEDARSAGRVRAQLEIGGKRIGEYDLLIAGQALRRNLTLVTANVREFSRVKDLVWEDWAKP